MLTIHTYSGGIRAMVNPTPNSEQECEIMGVDVFKLSFSVAIPISFKYGDYIIFDGRKYRLNSPVKLVKNATRDYEYSLILDSDIQEIGKRLFRTLDRLQTFTESEFSFTGTARDFLDLLVLNLNEKYPDYEYKIGSVIESTTSTLVFEGNNCLEVLGMLAEEFSTEWIVEGNKISLYKKQINAGLVLKYGKGEALYSMTIEPQTNANPITRVYGFGSTRNIGSNYRLGARRLRMAESLYLEKNTGIEIGGGPYDVVEVRKIFDDVYPRRKGIVSSVTSPFIFTDSSMDFNVNSQLMPGVDAKIEFNTGHLAGYSFNINNYNNGTKTFTINPNTEEQTLEIPSALLTPAIGDEYVIVDILMPDQYIINAELELKQKVQDYLDDISGEVPSLISVVCDPLYFKSTGRKVSLGELALVQDSIIGVNTQLRVISFTRNYIYPHLFTIKLAKTVKGKSLIKLINS